MRKIKWLTSVVLASILQIYVVSPIILKPLPKIWVGIIGAVLFVGVFTTIWIALTLLGKALEGWLGKDVEKIDVLP